MRTYNNILRLSVAFLLLGILGACAQQEPPAESVELLPNVPKEPPRDTSTVREPLVAVVDTLPVPDTAGAASRRRERPQTLPPTFSVVDSVVQLGNLPADTLVKLQFDFRNTGGKPLEISGVDRACGCTAVSFPFLPIVQGEAQSIKAEFNTKGKTGKQRIRLTVHSNDPNSPHTLYIQAIVGR